MASRADTAPAFVLSTRPALAHERIAAVLRDTWDIAGDLADAGGDRDQNLVVTAADGRRYLCKIGQPGEDPGVLEMQLAALRHVAGHDPALPVPAVIPTRDGRAMHAVAAAGRGEHRLRVFGYVAGQPLSRLERPPALLRDAGATLGRLDRALRGFFHPHADHRLPWDLRAAPALRACARDIAGPARRDRVLRILDDFGERVLPRLGGLRAQVIHGDATADNVLAQGDPAAVSGLVDFGDSVHAPLAQELAVAMADIPYAMEQPWAAACQLAAGYDEQLALEDDELALLWDLARARVALTAAVLAARAAHRPEGTGSMAAIVDACRGQLDALDAVGRDAAWRALRDALRLPEPVAGADTAAELAARRRERLMPGMALFYPGQPLHAVRGEGMWLVDAGGRRHLDCYNNVPHVGHGHPHVVNAVARQSGALNTHTRYLYDSVVAYAERLAGLLPGDLGVALFVNSGSEANDLAWRIALAASGHHGALVTRDAYHGNTAATAALSPCGGAEVPGHVRAIAVPGAGRGDATGGGSDADRAIAELERAGLGTAALFVDPSLASDGILEPPDGWLAGLFARVRAAGGLCIADEVQAGFGRLGTAWGFEVHGVVPDIVILGKPAANGYPLGAVITTPAIMAAFADRHDYFSTFGGNPVACTAGLAVLDVIEREGLVARAAGVGAWLRRRLAELQARHPRIAAVRGHGLFIGVELAGDARGRDRAGEEAARVALALRRDGVLVGLEGPRANVLKIRPPLVCEQAHAERLADALERVLARG